MNPRNPLRPESHCSHETLAQLLEDTLGEHDASHAQSHLENCDRCRQKLETIAGSRDDWFVTRDVLAEDDEERSASHPLDETLPGQAAHQDSARHWLAGILEPEPGDSLGRLDRYLVQQIIGVGGMGVVVSALDEQLNRPVAIKLLAPHLAPIGTARKRFARESRAVAAVVHPSIMPIYGINEDGPVPYLVMPLMPSGSLQMKINREGPLPLDQVVAIGTQIADGLSAAHANGLVHRDVKPGNILVEENSARILITDFGLARALDDASVTVSGMIAGTPQYMSPEQATGSRIDHRSDLFSLGSVLYAMATGRPPYRADTPVAVLRRIADEPFPPASEVREELPQWFNRLLQLFLAKDPEHRIASADKARELMHEVQLHLRRPSSHELPTVLKQDASTARRWTRFVAALLVGLTTITIALSLVAAYGVWGDRDMRQTDSDQLVPADSQVDSVGFPRIANDRPEKSTASRPRDSRTFGAPSSTRRNGSTLPNGPPTELNDQQLQWYWQDFEWQARDIDQDLNTLQGSQQATELMTLPLPSTQHPLSAREMNDETQP